ncbi:aminotransferase class I/II-fold pyridoxal phosphate-dependent enzyme [Mangrovivirga sp. M17]|uniref:Aminotransferase class I/II-fold pyridoxal phosphate-dependent enzyme n=1 Tax=Mangrovivirga halotolerans TaxID=2993936 RepID=A0ABT3RW96_9BACT|nr:aminotransferase class I/II-fold pyridoxal phosphate-dependent enzyme [Mangrovivirga halotolerans]MCX2745890.1 aminotransferase class I/II-fold pyridoxal phosphate-dependent enzyme [Mangrovivirga halotolerans]
MEDPKLSFETLAIKSIEPLEGDVSPVSTPLYFSTTYQRNQDGSYDSGFVYSRTSNPNRLVLENACAKLESGHKGFAFSSGMAAIEAVLKTLQAGDHIIIPDDAYFAVFKLIKEVFNRWGLNYTQVDMTDLGKLEKAISEKTKMIWLESPSNPMLKITDISAVTKLARENNVLVAVDNTWPTPVLQNPLKIGADVVVHSTTKYFGGHSDVLGGVVVINNNDKLVKQLENIQNLGGGVLSPFDSWLTARGLQTLFLRVKAQSESAYRLAMYLDENPNIEKVFYPGLPSHKGHEIAKKQMQNGFGAMLSVTIKGGEQEAIGVSNKLQLFTTATSLGGVESLIEHRKSVEGPESNTPDNLLRISVGLENIDDLISDWQKALT